MRGGCRWGRIEGASQRKNRRKEKKGCNEMENETLEKRRWWRVNDNATTGMVNDNTRLAWLMFTVRIRSEINYTCMILYCWFTTERGG